MRTPPPVPPLPPLPPPRPLPPLRAPAQVPLVLRPIAWLSLQAQLVALALTSAAFNLVAGPLFLLLPRAVGRRFGRIAIANGYRGYWHFTRPFGLLRLQADALDVLRDEAGLVIVANHPSLLDAMLLVARLPRCACVMKASLLRNPLLASGALLARYIPNDSAHGMVRRAVADLREGGQLLMFPEGTRTTHAPVNAFQPGFAVIAKHAQAPIQTVFIDTPSPYLGKGWPLWRLPPLPIEFSVRLGRRFEPRADHESLVREVEDYFAAGVVAPTAGPAA